MPIGFAMEIPGELYIFAGSLFAIFVIFALTRFMKLGGRANFQSEAAVAQAAIEVEDGFEVQRCSIARSAAAALARDPNGRIMIIKPHGNRFAGRILTSAASAREEVDALVVDPGPHEAQFGTVRLSLSDAAAWADAINRL